MFKNFEQFSFFKYVDNSDQVTLIKLLVNKRFES